MSRNTGEELKELLGLDNFKDVRIARIYSFPFRCYFIFYDSTQRMPVSLSRIYNYRRHSAIFKGSELDNKSNRPMKMLVPMPIESWNQPYRDSYLVPIDLAGDLLHGSQFTKGIKEQQAYFYPSLGSKETLVEDTASSCILVKDYSVGGKIPSDKNRDRYALRKTLGKSKHKFQLSTYHAGQDALYVEFYIYPTPYEKPTKEHPGQVQVTSIRTPVDKDNWDDHYIVQLKFDDVRKKLKDSEFQLLINKKAKLLDKRAVLEKIFKKCCCRVHSNDMSFYWQGPWEMAVRFGYNIYPFTGVNGKGIEAGKHLQGAKFGKYVTKHIVEVATIINSYISKIIQNMTITGEVTEPEQPGTGAEVSTNTGVGSGITTADVPTTAPEVTTGPEEEPEETPEAEPEKEPEEKSVEEPDSEEPVEDGKEEDGKEEEPEEKEPEEEEPETKKKISKKSSDAMDFAKISKYIDSKKRGPEMDNRQLNETDYFGATELGGLIDLIKTKGPSIWGSVKRLKSKLKRAIVPNMGKAWARRMSELFHRKIDNLSDKEKQELADYWGIGIEEVMSTLISYKQNVWAILEKICKGVDGYIFSGMYSSGSLSVLGLSAAAKVLPSHFLNLAETYQLKVVGPFFEKKNKEDKTFIPNFYKLLPSDALAECQKDTLTQIGAIKDGGSPRVDLLKKTLLEDCRANFLTFIEGIINDTYLEANTKELAGNAAPAVKAAAAKTPRTPKAAPTTQEPQADFAAAKNYYSRTSEQTARLAHLMYEVTVKPEDKNSTPYSGTGSPKDPPSLKDQAAAKEKSEAGEQPVVDDPKIDEEKTAISNIFIELKNNILAYPCTMPGVMKATNDSDNASKFKEYNTELEKLKISNPEIKKYEDEIARLTEKYRDLRLNFEFHIIKYVGGKLKSAEIKSEQIFMMGNPQFEKVMLTVTPAIIEAALKGDKTSKITTYKDASGGSK